MEKIISKFFYGRDDTKKIYTFNVLRFIFFIFIFVHHCYNNIKIPILKQPALAVSGFLILSGFLNGYIYKGKFEKINKKEIFEFSKKRIVKFYPLHIIMFFICISFSGVFNYTKLADFILFIKKSICNLLLIQSWINDQSYYFSFNGVTWFLSTYLFLTLTTIPFLIFLNRVNKCKYSKIIQIVLSIILFCITLALVYIVKINKLNIEFFIYVFPLSRIPEYFIGMIFGNLIKDFKISFKFDKIIFTILEVMSFILLYFTMSKANTIFSFSNLIDKRINLGIISIIFMLMVFSYQKGAISYLFKFKLLDYLGEISMYLFMIHQPLIRFVSKSTGNVIHYRYFALYILVLTILISGMIDNFKKKCKI